MSCPRCNSGAYMLKGGGRAKCRNCGKTYNAPDTAARQAREAAHFTADVPPSDLPSYEDLLERRREQTAKRIKADRARELIDVRLHTSGPFAVAMVGDPHIDNPGCNLELLLEHTRLIARTEGMFGLCVGDVQDGWVGRLARLWAHQGISAAESQVLVDGWLREFGGKLVALVEGNHDCWVHGVGGHSPLAWIESHAGTVREAHGVRLRLSTDDGQTVTINARHDFPGRSMYNAAHGPNKSLLFGCRDDVAVAGHTHVYGRMVSLNPESRKPMHAVRLGSYKHSDDYARALGLLDNNVTECAVLIVDPSEPDPRHRTWVEDNPFRAARVLGQLRAAHEAEQGNRRTARKPARRCA